MREIPVSAHTRHLPDKPRLIDNEVHCELRRAVRFMNRIRVKAVGRRVKEPLEGLDMPEWQKQQIRETGF